MEGPYFQSSPESLAHRLKLSKLLQPLKRVRARVPFFYLAAHRIPTLWTLYRGLLREAPTENIKARVSALFRENRHLTSLKTTKLALLKGHRWLSIFQNANQGDRHTQDVLSRYDRMLTAKREKERWKHVLREAMAWRQKLHNRPILTGAYHRPSLYNKPLPRLKPQPASLSMMIYKRRLAHERRYAKKLEIMSWREDIKGEATFERLLTRGLNMSSDLPVSFEKHFCGPSLLRKWDSDLKSTQDALQQTFDREFERLATPYPPELLKTIANARRKRFTNKRREHDREKRGEILPRTIKRRNRGPPAHILQNMTQERREMDRISRSVSEGGYVGMIKRRLGWKLKNTEAWEAEIGSPENKHDLDQMSEAIRQENLRRRSMYSDTERVETTETKQI